MENVVQPSTENEEVAIVDMALHLQPTVLNLESIQSTYHAASPPAPPPPSPISVISMEPPYYLFDLSVSEVDSADGMPCFVVMGCTYCYIYVMVSEADPYCPQCGTDDLLDQFCGNWGICKQKKNQARSYAVSYGLCCVVSLPFVSESRIISLIMCLSSAWEKFSSQKLCCLVLFMLMRVLFGLVLLCLFSSLLLLCHHDFPNDLDRNEGN